MNRCDELRLELGGYVLGGLAPAEAAEVEAHLATCDRCRIEVAELREVPEYLGQAWELPPRAPADLRARVLDAVGPSIRRRRVPALIAAALALAAAVVGGVTVSFVDRPPPADAVVALQGPEPVGIVGEAALTQVPAGVQVDLELTGVKDADEGYYHAWLHRGDLRVSAGTFVGPEDGQVDVSLLCGGRLEAYDRLTVTWHPFEGPDEVVAVEATFAAAPAGTDAPREPATDLPGSEGDDPADPWWP
jgi:hypothetical protein